MAGSNTSTPEPGTAGRLPVATRAAAAWLFALWLGMPAAVDAGPGPAGPGWGQPLDPATIEPRIWPDGRGLPPGRGDVATGAVLYRQQCQSCHGRDGRGASAVELAGGIGSLAGPNPDRTVGSFWPYAPPLFDYVRRAMPMNAPGSLDAAQVYAVLAYLLFINGLVGADSVVDARSLAALRMPNRDGFVDTWNTVSPSAGEPRR